MVKKTKTDDSSRTIREDVRQENIENPYQQMFRTWNEFSSQLGSNMTSMMNGGKSKRGGINTEWTKFYQDMTDNMAKSMAGENQAEIQIATNVYKNYSNIMMNRMSKMLEGGNDAQTKIQKTWQTYVPKIGEHIARTTQGNGEDIRVEDIFTTWTDFSTQMNQDFLSLVDTAVLDSQELMNMWNELNEEMRTLIETYTKTNKETYSGLSKNWQESSEKMGVDIKKFAEEYIDGFVDLRDTWTNYTSIMGNAFRDITKSSEVGMEDLYKNYMERTSQMFSVFNPSMFSLSPFASEEITALKKKVEELERKLEAKQKNA